MMMRISNETERLILMTCQIEHLITPTTAPSQPGITSSVPAVNHQYHVPEKIDGMPAPLAPVEGTNGNENVGRKMRRLEDGKVASVGEVDEDAINSDLDDSDDETSSTGGDDEITNIILCQYEKVCLYQRDTSFLFLFAYLNHIQSTN
jgi:hypothetical protein